MIKPIVKWAGGKRQISGIIGQIIPLKFERYIEPFAGGLAIFSMLYNSDRLNGGIISDANRDIMNLYISVRDNPEEVSEELDDIKYANNPESYYAIRKRFNGPRDLDSPYARSAMFLYLNRHCYNGLYRVNSRGEFNVPFGSYARTSLPGREELVSFGKALQGMDLRISDFEQALDNAGPGDLVYLDPPYIPVSKTSFVGYTGSGFSLADHMRLASACRKLDSKGSWFILSNSVSREMIPEYGDFNIMEISARRSINSDARSRSGHREIIVTNITPDLQGSNIPYSSVSV